MTVTTTTTSTAHILIVDDDVALLEALPHALNIRLNTMQIDTSDSALKALDMIQQNDYDAIVSDIKMPGMDGLTLLGKVREVRPDTPVLLITGHGEHELAVQALRGGAYDFIQKPIDRDYIVAALRRAIQTHQLRQKVLAQQNALRLHADSLERLVQRRTQELVEANAVKDKFLSIVSHELKSPLENTKTMISMLHQQVEQGAPTELVTRGLSDMQRSIARTEVLVQDLLDTSLIETNMFVLHRKRCDLVELCRRFLSEYTQGAGPDLTFDFVGDAIEVEVDENRIYQVLINLLSNARKYSPIGSPITIMLRQAGYEATIAVRDMGIGISEAALPYIFEQFYRAPNAEVLNGDRPGTGIGLFISRKIIERHGGRIDVQSVSGHGSIFSIILPVYIHSFEEQNEAVDTSTREQQGIQTPLAPQTQAVWTVTPTH
ncbi:MAG TPA: hybrid sensor histidine kinase/response regulator [Ktedonobacter sp.]|nr:hybrid sensor histidine kinase/response regulator [Ktedonobacter sp.]